MRCCCCHRYCCSPSAGFASAILDVRPSPPPPDPLPLSSCSLSTSAIKRTADRPGRTDAGGIVNMPDWVSPGVTWCVVLLWSLLLGTPGSAVNTAVDQTRPRPVPSPQMAILPTAKDRVPLPFLFSCVAKIAREVTHSPPPLGG